MTGSRQCAWLSHATEVKNRDMMSRYDYLDPGTDPAYCEGLEPDEPPCIYCGGPCSTLDDYEPYCSSLCSLYAQLDSLEDTQ